VAIHRHLKTLVEERKLIKAGTPPKVFYKIFHPSFEEVNLQHQKHEQLLNQYFAYVDPTGQLFTGLAAFTIWAKNVNKENQINSLLSRYSLDREEVNQLFTSRGWIDTTANISKTFGNQMALDGVFYLDFYSLPTFGKTRLGTFMLYAKQSENKHLIAQIADETKNKILEIIDHLNIDAVGFIPHSILRKTQFLKEYAQKLNLSLPQISIIKAYPGAIRVAQKTLGKLEERIANARETIFIENPSAKHDRVLLIDDATGSGSTLNETAKKLKNLGIAKQVYGFSIVGSLKGFEVVREV
jgi:hypothetical protein